MGIHGTQQVGIGPFRAKAKSKARSFDSFSMQVYDVCAMNDYKSYPAPPLAYNRRAVIACATVIEEMRPLLAPEVECCVLDFGLHVHLPKLKRTLQETVDALALEFDTILLGYGLCSMSVVGLQARDCTLVVPKVDDCIAIFLGSDTAYREQARRAPGTY
jgi:hypothetical protein